MKYGEWKFSCESQADFDRMFQLAHELPSEIDDRVYSNGYYGSEHSLEEKYASVQHTSSLKRMYEGYADLVASRQWN